MIVINILILMTFLIFYLKTKNYDSHLIIKLDKAQHKLKQFYPPVMYLLDYTPLKKMLLHSEKVDDSLKSVYIGEQIDTVKRYYYCKKIIFVVGALLLANIFSFIYNVKSIGGQNLMKGNYIARPDYETGTKHVDLGVQVSEGESILLEENIFLEIEEKGYDEIKRQELFMNAREYIDKVLSNQNKSLDEVKSDLTLPSNLPKSKILISWETGNKDIIDVSGKVQNENITEAELVSLKAVISYENRTEEYICYARVLPREITPSEEARRNLLQAVENVIKETKNEDKVNLPEVIGGQQVLWREKTDYTGVVFLLFGVVAAVFLFLLIDIELHDKVEKRNQEMLLDYPEIISKFTLFVGAGMSASNAFRKIAKDYKEKSTTKRYAYEEIMRTYNEIMVGVPEVSAYEKFGKRIKLLPYLRFSALTAQNIKKGTKDFLVQLELETAEAFEERKELAKKIGEEAGTKLLVPMMIMLGIVLAIIMVPAFISFNF